MKEPISPEDIRAGDLIRTVYAPTKVNSYTAAEYKAAYDGDDRGLHANAFFLLERVKPTLPTKPATVGVATISGVTTAMIRNRHDQWISPMAVWYVDDEIDAFTECKLVPKEAWRKWIRDCHANNCDIELHQATIDLDRELNE